MSAPAVVVVDVAKVYRRFLHKNQFRTLKSALLTGSLLSDLTPDQTFTALMQDLQERGLLDETLVVWGGEFGRLPIAQLPADKNERKAGRDHNKNAFCSWLAGGGVKGGTAYGATDELGFHAVENRHYVTDIHATVLKLLGLDSHRLEIPGQAEVVRGGAVRLDRVRRPLEGGLDESMGLREQPGQRLHLQARASPTGRARGHRVIALGRRSHRSLRSGLCAPHPGTRRGVHRRVGRTPFGREGGLVQVTSPKEHTMHTMSDGSIVMNAAGPQ